MSPANENVANGFSAPAGLPSAWEHYTNPMHVYCRLCDCRIPKAFAKKICAFYEKHIHPLLV